VDELQYPRLDLRRDDGGAYFLLPLVNIPEIEARARAAGPPPEIMAGPETARLL